MSTALPSAATNVRSVSSTAGSRCLVLGGAGFIGSHLVDGLLASGHQVTVFDRPGMAPSHMLARPALRILEGDLSNEGDVTEAFAGIDVCFHLISTTLPKSSNADPVFDLESNLVATVRMLQQAVAAGLRKVVFLSSGGTVYGAPQYLPIDEDHVTNPICSYGIAKLAIEKYLELFRHLHGLDYAVIRLSNPYGERQRINASQGAVAVFLGKVLRGESVEIWGDGTVVRDYIHISDVVSALISSAGYQGQQRILNIGSGRGMSLNEVLDGMEQVTGLTAKRVYLPSRPFDVPVSVLSIGRAQSELNWHPEVGFVEGIGRMARWLEKQS